MRRVLTFYKFQQLADPETLQATLLRAGHGLDIKGTILLAAEGINGTLVGSEAALRDMQQHLDGTFPDLPYKWSDLDEGNPGFYRFKVKIKPEIVTLGVGVINTEQGGEHVDPSRWNELLDDPEVLVIDTRNTYEIDIGTFPSAISPATTNFREFPGWVESALDPAEHPRVAMFCTGGIRCEKASAYLLAQGFDEVYQLDGGVLSYLEHVASDENRWQGECFVFDQRVSVNAELQEGVYQQCFACRHPLSQAELDSPQFEQGVSCPHCFDPADEDRLTALRERQRQVELAAARGTSHVGATQGE